MLWEEFLDMEKIQFNMEIFYRKLRNNLRPYSRKIIIRIIQLKEWV
jgi:hypothetical protein